MESKLFKPKEIREIEICISVNGMEAYSSIKYVGESIKKSGQYNLRKAAQITRKSLKDLQELILERFDTLISEENEAFQEFKESEETKKSEFCV